MITDMLKTENMTKVFLADEVETTALNRVNFPCST